MLLLLLGLALAVEVRAEDARLNLFIWSEYIPPAVVADFARQFRCKVNIDLYEDVESMFAKLQGGGVSLYDVVVPTDHILPAMIQLGLLAPLRPENLPNLKHLEARFLHPPYDPQNRYTAAYQWGTVGVLARRGKTPLPDTWGLFFDPRQQPGPFLLIDSMRDLIGPALKFKGHSVNSTDPAALKQARALLLEAKKRSLGFDGSVGAKNKILAKTACAAIVYSGEGVRAMAEDPDTIYFIPREGSILWVDSLAVPARAPHRDLAEKFINFVLEPQNGARISAFTRFATPNQAAKALLSAADRDNPAIYPSPETTARLEFLKDLGAKLRLYDEVWTQVKAK